MATEVIVDRDRIQVIIAELTRALDTKSNIRFKLQIKENPAKLIITPQSEPIEIVL